MQSGSYCCVLVSKRKYLNAHLVCEFLATNPSGWSLILRLCCCCSFAPFFFHGDLNEFRERQRFFSFHDILGVFSLVTASTLFHTVLSCFIFLFSLFFSYLGFLQDLGFIIKILLFWPRLSSEKLLLWHEIYFLIAQVLRSIHFS